MAEAKQIGDFEIVDHGIEHCQYWQGCGADVYEECASGCGENPADALDDLLEQIAMSGDWETDGLEGRICEQLGIKKMPLRPRVKASMDEHYYYLSMRWNPAVVNS